LAHDTRLEFGLVVKLACAFFNCNNRDRSAAIWVPSTPTRNSSLPIDQRHRRSRAEAIKSIQPIQERQMYHDTNLLLLSDFGIGDLGVADFSVLSATTAAS